MQTRAVARAVSGGSTAVDVRTKGPVAAGLVLWRDEADRVLATIAAKITYALEPGACSLVDTPDPIRDVDVDWEEGKSLRFSSDLVPFKPVHEVVVVGHVYASGGRPTQAVTARLVVGDVEKLVTATATRRANRDGLVLPGEPQSRFSLRYEVAAAGPDNPVGIDPTALTSKGDYVLPQLAPPNLEVQPGDFVPVVSFGPISPGWRSRDSLLRPEDRDWLRDPLRRRRPRAFDATYFCAAPLDQRSAEPLRADARLILEGLHPRHPRLVTNLAGVTPALRAIGARQPLPNLVADTLVIDTDRSVATLTFRATIPLGHDRLVLEVVAGEQAEATSDVGGEATAELDRRALDLDTSGREATTELDRSVFGAAAATALPFAPASEPGRTAPPRSDDGALPFRRTAPPSAPPSSPPVSAPPPLVGPPTSVPAASPPRPALVSAPAPLSATGEPSAPRAPISSPPPLAVARSQPPEPTVSTAEAGSGTEVGDLFRRAFGLPAARAGTGESSVAQPASARAASDAAIATVGRPSAAGASLEKLTALERRAVVDLLAFEPNVPSRLRRSKVHAPLLAVVAPPRAHQKVDAPAGEQSADDRARADVSRVLSCGAPLGLEDLQANVEALFEDPHDLEMPLALVEGDVRPTMDEGETLRVTAEIAKALAGDNKRVHAAIAIAQDALARSIPPLPETAASLAKQIELATNELSLPARYFADIVDRTLLEARSYKKRLLLGALRIRAELTLGKGTLPVYLPESAASHLPLLPVFPATALVELRPREDASESNAVALVAHAFGRVLRARRSAHRG